MPSARAQQSFQDYVAQETSGLAKGEKLLAPEQVMERLTISRRQLQALHGGRHPRGLYLPAYRIGQKTIRYRLRDVLKVEWDALHGTAVD